MVAGGRASRKRGARRGRSSSRHEDIPEPFSPGAVPSCSRAAEVTRGKRPPNAQPLRVPGTTARKPRSPGDVGECPRGVSPDDGRLDFRDRGHHLGLGVHHDPDIPVGVHHRIEEVVPSRVRDG